MINYVIIYAAEIQKHSQKQKYLLLNFNFNKKWAIPIFGLTSFFATRDNFCDKEQLIDKNISSFFFFQFKYPDHLILFKFILPVISVFKNRNFTEVWMRKARQENHVLNPW